MDLITPGFGLIFWQTLVFLIVLFILGKYAWKPIMESLKNREESIQEALDAAENARKDIEKLTADNESLLQEARLERDSIIKDATIASSKLKEEAKEDAAKITAKMLDDARNTINAEKNAAIAEIKSQVAELSIEISEKILKRSLAGDKEQRALIKEYMKDIELN